MKKRVVNRSNRPRPPRKKNTPSKQRPIPPAHVMSIQRGQTVSPPRAYWDVSFDEKHELGEAAAQDELIEGLREAGSGHVPELVAINPGVVFGPALDKDLSTSHILLKMMGRGSYPLLPRVAFPTVDVRDVAAMHVRAMTHERAAGERFICADETLSLRQIGEALVDALPDLKRKVPTRHLPSGLVRFAARFDRNLRSIRGDLDKANLCDTSKARNELGFTFRPAREAVSSAALSLRELGVI